MFRHVFLAIAILLFFLSSPLSLWANADRPPNVILIMADDLGYGDISPYGGWVKTPHLEALAKAGVQFMDFHASASVCSPTRAGLLTGLYQQRLGIPGVLYANPTRPEHYAGLGTEQTTMAEVFREHGYRTALFGKWHLGYQAKHNPILHGFDEFRGFVSGNVDYQSHIDLMGREDWWRGKKKKKEAGYLTDLISKHAVNFIEENSTRPFFLYLPHHAPHLPFQGPNDPADRMVGGKFPVAGTVQDRKRAYREMIESMDDGVGLILEAVKKNRLEQQTIIWFFSDNGALSFVGSNAPLRGEKGEDWEGGHRVPSILSWSTRIAPRKTNILSSTLDVMPTVLNLAGIDYAGKTDGMDLSSFLLHGRTPEKNRKLFWWGDQKQAWKGAAMREGPYKLVVDQSQNQRPNIYLFDLEEDLGEQHNIAKENPKKLKSMLSDLSGWHQEVMRSK